MKLQYCLSVMIQNKTEQYRLLQNKPLFWIIQVNTFTEFLTHSSPALSEAGFSHITLQTAFTKMLHWFHFALVATNDTHSSLKNLKKKGKKKKKRLKTLQNKGNTRQVFGEKPQCHVTITGNGFGFQHRRFSRLSHFSASGGCAAAVAFCLHVADWCLWRWSKQSPIGAWSNERVKCNNGILSITYMFW